MDPRGQRSWTRRAFEATGWPAPRAGIALAAAGSAVFLVQEAALGRFGRMGDDPALLADARITVTHVVIVAYMLAASVYYEQVRDATLREVTERLGGATRAVGLGGAGSFAALLVGVGGAAILSVTVSPGETSYAPGTFTPETGWHRVLGLAIGATSARLFALVVVESGRLSERAAVLPEIDLLAPQQLAPFVRLGLTGALLAMGAFAVFSLFLVERGYLPIVVGLLAFAAPAGGLALLLPLRGLRLRVRQAKGAELAWCRARIRQARDRLRGGQPSGDLEELLAWEARIEAIPDWPVDASTLQRFGLYLLIPLGSWAGGALVERAVDALLD